MSPSVTSLSPGSTRPPRLRGGEPELLDREVFAALGEHAGDFDLEAITAHLVEHDNVPYDQASQTFHLAIDVDELWAVLFRYDMSGIALDA